MHGDSDVYIGREHRGSGGKYLARSMWANPFRLRDCKDVGECLEKFECHLLADSFLLSNLHRLAGKRLLCHCARTSPCHGDVLIKHFAQRFAKEEASTSLLVGVYHSPSEFATLALGCVHPFLSIHLEPSLLDSIGGRMTNSVDHTRAARANALAHWTKVAVIGLSE